MNFADNDEIILAKIFNKTVSAALYTRVDENKLSPAQNRFRRIMFEDLRKHREPQTLHSRLSRNENENDLNNFSFVWLRYQWSC